MKQSQNKRSVMVGIFIFLGLAILVVGILTLGGQKKMFEKTFSLKAVFNDVAGLQEGNNVWHSGIKIGTVNDVILLKGGLVEVDMKINKKFREHISRDAKVKIGSDGLIGNKIVIIYGGTEGIASVEKGDTLQSELPLHSENMMSTLQESNRNLSLITSDLKTVTRNLAQGEGTLGELFTQDTLINQLKSMAAFLQLSSQNLHYLTINLASYSQSMRKQGVLANELVSDTVLFSRLKDASAQIQQASINAKQLTNNLNEVSYRLRDSSNLAGVVFQDKVSAENLRNSVENLQSGTKKFDENMEALRHNFLFRGYFRKREKEMQQQQKAQSTANGVSSY